MSDFLIYINVSPYVAEWAISHLGNPIEFPKDSVENRLIKKFLDKTPTGESPDTKGDSNLSVKIPFFKLKDPRTYNYMCDEAKELLVESLETLLVHNMWSELGSLENLNCSMKKCIIAWCRKHGISEAYEDTIAQKFYRLRKRYARKGIFLAKNRTDFED